VQQQEEDVQPARVCDLPRTMRPRELMDQLGVEHVPDSVLLAILLRSGIRGNSVVELAETLLRRYHGSLTAMAAASERELQKVCKGLGKVKAQVLRAALELGRRAYREEQPERLSLKTPADVARLLREDAWRRETEAFWVLLLDSRNGLKGRPVEITRGLVNASMVHPREVFMEAIRSATASVILAHNHPSGDPTPSAEDLRITRQMVEVGKLMQIRVQDHIILGKAGGAHPEFLSLRESGAVAFE